MTDETDKEGNGVKASAPQQVPRQSGKAKSKSKDQENTTPVKRRCVSTACIACRKRKSKCDGNTPSCAACSSVYHTPCVYDPNSDHRRKGVYKQDIDNLRNRNTTLQTLVQAILNYDEDDVLDLVRQIRAAENLETIAESILQRENKLENPKNELPSHEGDVSAVDAIPKFESELSGNMSELKLDGAVKYIGGTSNLIFLPEGSDDEAYMDDTSEDDHTVDDNITCWTAVTKNKELIRHLLTMYFTWHYTYFTALSKRLFYRDFIQGRSTQHCSPLLVNAMLALACHFSAWPAARRDPDDPTTCGDHFFKEAKKLILENDEHEKAKLCTVQALALMSVREAGCCREGSGWVYSGMSFRMAYDLGLNVDSGGLGSNNLSDEDIDARRITFWGCFLFDKCWSNYLGRQPQLSGSHITVPKFEVFAEEDAETWSPYTDAGVSQDHMQASRTRAVALQNSKLCEISSDLLSTFYHPAPSNKHMGKQEELRKLSQLHTRLEAWRKALPKEMEPKDGQLPQILIMHMFFQLLFIHLYRPFLKYTKSTSPLPPHVSPRKLCTQSASVISKLFRMYKRSYGFRHICNLAVYIAHSACTIHLLNIPDKAAKRDFVHGLKSLEEISESWLCARRTLRILDLSSRKWNIALPDEAVVILDRSRNKFGPWRSSDQTHSPSSSEGSPKLLGHVRRSVPSTHHSTPDPAMLLIQPPLHSVTQTASQPSQSPHPISKPPILPLVPHEAKPSSSLKQETPVHDVFMSIKPEQEMGTSTFSHSPRNTPQSSGGMALLENFQPQAYFGSENLVEASQNWWLKDQSALAVGLDNWSGNWNSPPEGPCFSVNLNPNMPATPAASTERYKDTPQSHIAAGVNMDMDVPITSCEYGDDYLVSQSNQQEAMNQAHPFLDPQDGGNGEAASEMFYSPLPQNRDAY